MAANVAGEEMIIRPLGGGQEVGRSCILLKYRERQIMLDCGAHPGREGNDSLPFFDLIDNPEEIDLILITHFHIDHVAALPYFTEKTNFRGKVLMTHATKAVMKILLSDNIKLQSRSNMLYNEQDLQNCVEKIDTIDFHQTIDFKGIKVTATPAGHVLGAAMFLIDIDNIKVLYTGDYSMEDDRHLSKALLPCLNPDVLIVESTFGTTCLHSKEKREADFTRAVESIVSRGGNCLIPVFALGRAQELLLILDDYWSQNPDLQDIPIYYASKLANKSLKVFQTFTNMMNDHVISLAESFQNPFKLKHIKSITAAQYDQLTGPCVVMASPGFLQSGVSRELFELWCDDEKHGVIVAGYTVEGTLAHELLSMPTEIKCSDNRIKPRRCSIDHISFSAHVDYAQNRQFIATVSPDYIVLVHGEANQMKRLKDALEHEIKHDWAGSHKPAIATPDNGAKVKLRFRKNIVADAMGQAAVQLLQSIEASSLGASSSSAAGVSLALPPATLLVTENFSTKLVQASELSQFSSCRLGSIQEHMCIPVPPDVGQLVCYGAVGGGLGHAAAAQGLVLSAEEHDAMRRGVLNQVLDQLQRGFYDVAAVSSTSLTVQSLVTVALDFQGAGGALQAVRVSWAASPLGDVLADSAVALLTQYFSAPSVVRRAIEMGSHSRGGSAREEEEDQEERAGKRRKKASGELGEGGQEISVV